MRLFRRTEAGFESHTDIAWDHSYEIGQPEIDAQHRFLIQLIRRLDYVLHHPVQNVDLVLLLREVKKYADFHFASEESYMHAIGYPARAEHGEIHSHMLSELSVRILKARQSWRNAEPLLEFLATWLRTHIAGEDKKIAAYASTIPASFGWEMLQSEKGRG